MTEAQIDAMTTKAAKQAVEEYTKTHVCRLTEEQIHDLQLVSGFLTRMRNAIGNAVMVFIFVLILGVVCMFVWGVTLGKINPFKAFGF